MKKTLPALFIVLLVCICLHGCKSSNNDYGFLALATGEEVSSSSLAFPSKIEYAGEDQTLYESAELELSFDDDTITVSADMYEVDAQDPSLKHLVVSMDFMMDYEGRLKRKTVQIHAEPFGQIETTYEYTYEEDASGNTIKREYTTTQDRDLTCSEKTEYYPNVTIKKETRYLGDVGSTICRVATYEYDGDGNRIKEVTDNDGDPDTPEETHYYAYSAVFEDIIDLESDDTLDEKHVYDEDNGYPVFESCYLWNTNEEKWDQIPEWSDSWYYTFDKSGKPTRIAYNKYNDINIDGYTYVTWTTYDVPEEVLGILNINLDNIENTFLAQGGM
ncbi:MAG: hypothetical protein JXM72_04895 [Deltaproteobacteria bacterium]|nr:hypothetical protein [Deltaproteobacteria bacterium]